jgi:hypothetical protein
MEMLKQAGMIAVLALLSEGLLLLQHALGVKTGVGVGLHAAELFAGAVLCSSGLVLLYSLGTRYEK